MHISRSAPRRLVKSIVLGAVLIATSSGCFARASNYNPNAGGNGNGNGAANANCNSALILSCDGADGAPATAPGEALSTSLLAAGTVLLAIGAAQFRRRGLRTSPAE